MSGLLGEGKIGRLGRFASKGAIGTDFIFGSKDPLDLFTKIETPNQESSRPTKGQQAKGQPNKKNQRKVKAANTPLSSDPANPISTNPLGGI